MKIIIYIWLPFIFFLTSCTNKQSEKAIDLADMDMTANPADDFYQYANGGWIAKHPIPDDRSQYSPTEELVIKSQIQTNSIINELTKHKQKHGSIAEKIARFYKSGMDSLSREKEGTKAIKFLFDQIDSVSNVDDLVSCFAFLGQYQICAPLYLNIDSDPKNTRMTACFIYYLSTILPDKAYYISDDGYFQDIRLKYKGHIAKMLTLYGEDSTKAHCISDTIYNIEHELALLMADRNDTDAPDFYYNKMTIDELSQKTANINWNTFFESSGCHVPEYTIVMDTTFIYGLDRLVCEIPIKNWKQYLKWIVLDYAAQYLNYDIEYEDFAFYEQYLTGVEQFPQYWQRVTDCVNKYFDDAIGSIYIKKHFTDEYFKPFEQMTLNLKKAYKKRIQELDWMSDTTKAVAIEKIDSMNVKIGYPKKLFDYSELEIGDSYATNVLNIYRCVHEYWTSMIGKEYDTELWFTSPQTVNTYYDNYQNEITICAAILQPPFFYSDGDDAVNYGAIGCAIGHEMTHGFDLTGCQYDKNGNIDNWWNEADMEKFKDKSQSLKNRFNTFFVCDSIQVDGTYTLDENLADLGGIIIAYEAFKETEQWKDQSKTIDGLTPDQRFFIAYAQSWAIVAKQEYGIDMTLNDEHVIDSLRVKGPLPSIDPFIKAFDIKTSNKYYLPDSLKTRIW